MALAMPIDSTQDAAPSRTAEIAGIFGSYDATVQAARELYRSGFHHWEVFRSLPPQSGAASLAERAADDPETPRTEHVCLERLHATAGYLIGGLGVLAGIGAAWGVASSQAGLFLAILIVALLGGGGALAGLLIAWAMARFDRQRLIATGERDGLVLWAKPHSAALETTAVEIMRRHGGKHVHPVPLQQ